GGQVVNPRTTQTVVTRTAGANPSTYGDSVTFTATVTGTGPGSGNPGAGEGSVTFKADGTAVCGAVALNASGQAACSTSALKVPGSPHTIKAEYSGATNFLASSGTLTGGQTVQPRTLTPHITAQNKEYDGTTTATLSSQTLSGVIAGDVVSLTVTAANFDNKNVGTGKTVTATGLSLTGADAGNYQLSSTTATTTADITAKAVIPHITANNKEYDGTTTATLSGQTLLVDLSCNVLRMSGTKARPHLNTGRHLKSVPAIRLSL